MTRPIDPTRRHVVTGEEPLPHEVRASEWDGARAGSGGCEVVVDVIGSGRLTSSTISELLTMARRTGGRIVVRAGSRRQKRALVHAGLQIAADRGGTSSAARLRSSL